MPWEKLRSATCSGSCATRCELHICDALSLKASHCLRFQEEIKGLISDVIFLDFKSLNCVADINGRYGGSRKHRRLKDFFVDQRRFVLTLWPLIGNNWTFSMTEKTFNKNLTTNMFKTGIMTWFSPQKQCTQRLLHSFLESFLQSQIIR